MIAGLIAAWPDVFGAPGVRDPKARCEMFDPVPNIDWMGAVRADGTGNCDTDGHYLCSGCKHLSRRARLERLDLICPNCGEEAPGGLYSYEPEDRNLLSVTHCGCFHEGDPRIVACHALLMPYGPSWLHELASTAPKRGR